MFKNLGGHGQVVSETYLPPARTSRSVEEIQIEISARRAFFCIRTYSPAGLADIFEGFEGIFVPAGSGLGTYDLMQSVYISPNCI